jgi:Tfp pilus assembly protein PilO
MLKSLQTRDLMATLEGIRVKPSNMLLAFAGVLVIACVAVGASYLVEKRQQAGLREQIQAGGGTLSGTSSSQQDLKDMQERLTYLNASLENLQTSLPTKLDSAAIVQGLLSHAAASNVAIEQMNALPATEVTAQKQGGPSYMALRYTLVIQGALPDMLAFLSKVETDTAQTAAIGDAEIAESEGQSKMTLSISFYSRSEAAGGSPSDQPDPN